MFQRIVFPLQNQCGPCLLFQGGTCPRFPCPRFMVAAVLWLGTLGLHFFLGRRLCSGTGHQPSTLLTLVRLALALFRAQASLNPGEAGFAPPLLLIRLSLMCGCRLLPREQRNRLPADLTICRRPPSRTARAQIRVAGTPCARSRPAASC